MEKTVPNKLLVMVVDDVQDGAYAVATLIEMWGYKVVVANDPYTAIALAKSEPVDVFVLDIGMPGMDGYDLGAFLKKEYPEAGFIGNSAWKRDWKREEAVGFSFDAFVQKPIGFRELEKLIPIVAAQKGIQIWSSHDSLRPLASNDCRRFRAQQ